MKVHLMFEDKDFDYDKEISETNSLLMSDLGFENIITTMSNGDELIKSVCTLVLANPLNDIKQIEYRQKIQKDIIANSNIIFDLFNICKETGEEVRYSRYSLTSERVSSIFSSAVGLIIIYIKRFGEIRKIVDKNIKKFNSDGIIKLFNMLQEKFSDSFISQVQRFLSNMNEVEGTLISAKFGSFLQGCSFVYRKEKNEKLNPRMKFAPSYTLPERDNLSAEDLNFRKAKALNETANVLAKVAESFENFFISLKNEIAFYVGCINLYNKLNNIKMPVCIPEFFSESPSPDEVNSSSISGCNRSWVGLYDISLALIKNEKIVGNDNNIICKQLCIITGANQGGKTTFLKSIGQAQLMAQCGMLVGAESFKAPIKNNIFTHFKKEEDSNMNSGKLDEEMSRMDKIVSVIKKGDMLLSNESFSSTNEREGSEIFIQITKALVENNVEIFSVTHMCEYATAFLNNSYVDFLKAEHTEDGNLTFKIKPGAPSLTAFGDEIYKSIFNK